MAGRKRKIDVLMLSRAFPPAIGGVATHVAYLVEALSTLTRSHVDHTRVCRVEVVTATEDGPRATAEASYPVGRKGVRPFRIVRRLPGEKSHFLSVGDVPLETPLKFLLDNWHKIRPDVVHAHDFESFQIGLMLKVAFGKPLILTVHRTPKESDPTLRQRDTKNCFLQMVRRFDLADMIVAPSEAYMKHVVDEGFDPKQVTRIYHGVPIRKLAALRNKGGVLDRLRLEPVDELILCPIRLDQHKGPDTFIDAAALLKEKLNHRRLVFAIAGGGNSDYRNELRQHAIEKGVESIVRLGASDGRDFLSDEMPTLYRRASACVLPSKREGFGQVLLEAAAFKCPVVAANTGGIPEVVVPWKTGLLFNRGEPADLASQLGQLLEDDNLAHLLVEGATEQLGRRFDAEIMAREYLKLYQRVTGLSLR